jgi:hypothetical protein
MAATSRLYALAVTINPYDSDEPNDPGWEVCVEPVAQSEWPQYPPDEVWAAALSLAGVLGRLTASLLWETAQDKYRPGRYPELAGARLYASPEVAEVCEGMCVTVAYLRQPPVTRKRGAAIVRELLNELIAEPKADTAAKGRTA